MKEELLELVVKAADESELKTSLPLICMVSQA